MMTVHLHVKVTYCDQSVRTFMVDGDTTVQDFIHNVENHHASNSRLQKMEVLQVVERPTGVVPTN